MLGRSLRVNSEPGAGTRMKVRVPLDGRKSSGKEYLTGLSRTRMQRNCEHTREVRLSDQEGRAARGGVGVSAMDVGFSVPCLRPPVVLVWGLSPGSREG
jgi:hypothetical protein